MKRAGWIACLLLLLGSAAAQPPAPTSNADGQQPVPPPVVVMLDPNRLMTDRPYAEQFVANLDRIEASTRDDPAAAGRIEQLRLLALPILGRTEEARRLIDQAIARRSREAEAYISSWRASVAMQDHERAVTVLETASQNVAGPGWATLRQYMPEETIFWLLRQLHTQHREQTRIRLAQALFRIGWSGDGEAAAADDIRLILVEDRIAHGDTAGAAGFAASISTPSYLLPMITQTRFDPIFARSEDRIELLRRALEASDRETSDALVAGPDNIARAFDRAVHLRSVARDAEALAVLEPFTRDIPATVARGRHGIAVINEAADVLLTLGRDDEAVALMRRLVALPLTGNAALIGPSINYSEMLWRAGRFAEGLDHARWLEREAGQYSNDYGKMWIASSIVCNLASLDRRSETGEVIGRMRQQSDANPAALSRAYLCLGDIDAAAALMVQRLGTDDAETAILALQDYTLGSYDASQQLLHGRLQALRQRPEVRAALGRVGRILSLPLAGTYWGAV